MLLERFRQAKLPEVEMLVRQEKEGLLPAPFEGDRPDFLHALRNPSGGKPLAIIAEFKQASPSRGVIAEGLCPEDVAHEYAVAGADCLSILTEKEFFGGETDYLFRMAAPGIPMLRKDFIFHPLQVIHTAATPASALLLIVRLTPDAGLLRQLREQAESYGIHAVVEVFDDGDLMLARESGAKIIQVNARDLDTLQTDRNACLELAGRKMPGEIWIAASAMENATHLLAAVQAGYDAALIGTALMENGTPGVALSHLVQQLEKEKTHES